METATAEPTAKAGEMRMQRKTLFLPVRASSAALAPVVRSHPPGDRPMAPPPLTIHLFGPLRATVRGEPLPRVRTRSVEWLLALLTLRHGRAVDRSWLAGTLWPESSGSRALQNLRNDLVALRKALGTESGRLHSPALDALTLDLAGAAVDVLQFDAAIRAGDDESLRGAVDLYTGPLLEGCVEEWAFSERNARAEQLLTALET